MQIPSNRDLYNGLDVIWLMASASLEDKNKKKKEEDDKEDEAAAAAECGEGEQRKVATKNNVR